MYRTGGFCKSQLSAGNCPVMQFLTALVYLYCTTCFTNAINDLCIKMYAWCSRRAASCCVLTIAIWYCVYAGLTTNAPGIGGGTNGASGTTVLYCAALTSIPKYKFELSPRVHGNASVFALSCRNILCKLSKVCSPMIFVSTWYSKYNSLRLIFTVVLILGKISWRYSVISWRAVVTCTFDTLYRSDHRSVLLTTLLLQRILDIIELSLVKLMILQFTVWTDHCFWCSFIWLVVTYPCCVTSYLYSCINVLIYFW